MRMQKISDFLIFLDQGWVGILIGVLIAGWIYIKSRKTDNLSFQMSALRLIGRDENNLPNEVRVTFKGKMVERLTKTTLVIWNGGTKTIDGKDVVETDPLSATFDEKDKILSYKILKCTRKVNNFTITPDKINPHKLRFEFSYLDRKDGVVIEMLHDSEAKYPTVSGTIKGLPKGLSDRGTLFSSEGHKKHRSRLSRMLSTRRTDKLVAMLMFFVGLFVVAMGVLSVRFTDLMVTSPSITDSVLVVSGSVYMIFSLFLWGFRRKYPKQLETNTQF